MERRQKLAALQMTQGHRSGKHYKATRLPTHLSHGKKTRCRYHLEGHDTRGQRQAREPHHKNPDTTPRTWRAEGELFTYASEDEHGRHYRSCATEWGWREDENRPPYKRPNAIIRANAKTQLDYQTTFHMERKPAAGIIWRGTTRGDQDKPGSHTTITPTQLQGLGEQKGNCSHMPPRMSMADITAHALSSGDGEKMKIDHPTNDTRPSFGQTRKQNSTTNPPFTRKKNPLLVSSGGARHEGTKMS